MWGIQWCFAHNGDVARFSNDNVYDIPALGKAHGVESTFTPVGDTDSEAIFCAILNALKEEFVALPTLDILYDTIKRLCCEIVNVDNDVILNFLLGCGQYTQFAFSWPGSRPGSKVWNGLHYTLRRPPFTSVRLTDLDCSIDFSKTNGINDRMAVIATKPLTMNENWIEMKRGELIMFDKGLPYSIACDCAQVEKAGRGLSSRWRSRSISISDEITEKLPMSEPLNSSFILRDFLGV